MNTEQIISKINSLELHNSLQINKNLKVVKVLGGLMYIHHDTELVAASIFVPYVNEQENNTAGDYYYFSGTKNNKRYSFMTFFKTEIDKNKFVTHKSKDFTDIVMLKVDYNGTII
jgi:hypothetical protein